MSENKDHKKIKIELTAIDGSFVMNIQGRTAVKKCLCLPIDDAHLYQSEKTGRVYLDLVAWETKNVMQSGDTHNIKRSLSMDESKTMSQEEKERLPILGNVGPLSKRQPQQAVASDPQQPSGVYQNLPEQANNGELPF